MFNAIMEKNKLAQNYKYFFPIIKNKEKNCMCQLFKIPLTLKLLSLCLFSFSAAEHYGLRPILWRDFGQYFFHFTPFLSIYRWKIFPNHYVTAGV